MSENCSGCFEFMFNDKEDLCEIFAGLGDDGIQTSCGSVFGTLCGEANFFMLILYK